MKKIILILLSLPCISAAQQNAVAGSDTIPVQHVKWCHTKVFQTVFTPALLFSYGLAISGNSEVPVSSREVQQWRQKNFASFNTNLDNYLPSSSLVVMFGLDAAGVHGEHNWLNQALIFAIANALNGYVTNEIKSHTAVLRPDATDKLSFPSAHTSSAFVAAEMLHQEYKHKSPWISVAGYTLAASVGAMRVLNNRHWLSDVFAGAGVGMLSVRLTCLAFPEIHKKMCEL